MSENNNINWYETDLTDTKYDRDKPYERLKKGLLKFPMIVFLNVLI